MKRTNVAAGAGLALIVLTSVASNATAQTAVAPAAAAETAPPAAAAPGITFGPDLTLTANAGLFSDYRFRGFTQTGYKPAFQGGFDLSHGSGLYIGNWNSNVEQGLYRGASLEMDFYGGYKYTFLEDFTADVGYYYYYYPTRRTSGQPSSTAYLGYSKKAAEGEAYVGLSWKTLSVKYWYATTNYFGLGDSFAGSREIDTSGSSYVELNGTYDFGGGWGAVAHVGLQSIKRHAQFTDIEGNPLAKNVTDWKIGATKDLSGFVVGLAVVGTSHRKYFGTATSFEAGGNTRVLASVAKTF